MEDGGWIIVLLLFGIGYFIYLYPGWAFLVAIAVGAVVFYFYDRDKKRKQAAALAAAEREEARRTAIKADAEKTMAYFRGVILTGCLVVDSNIWMNEGYDDFFRVLRRCTKRASTELVLYGPQFDEMCNIKRTAGYGEDRNRRARIAISRIEAFQKENLLRVEPITINADKFAYADPPIVKLLITEAKAAKTLCFVSDDKELRIRVRENLRRIAPNSFTIVEIGQILHSCSKVAEAENLQLIEPVA